VTLGTREEQNPYTAELAAIARALENLPAGVCHRHITIVTRNQSALAALKQPGQQSGQGTIRQVYELAKLHQQRGNSVDFLWIPAESDFALGAEAKAAAQRHAAMLSDQAREPLVLPGRESAVRPKGMVARNESGPRDNQVRNGDGEVECGWRARQGLNQSQ
jgi:hypothetical protein